MSVLEILASPRFILALIGHALLAPTLLILFHWLLSKLNEHAAGTVWAIEFNNWTARHIWLPLIRVIALLSFILLAYPILYGIAEAPRLTELINSSRINTLINVLFVISVLLPLIPILGEAHALVLPIQSIAGAQLLFNWLNQHHFQQEISLLPGFNTFLSLLALVYLAHWLSQHLAFRMGEVLDDYFHVDGSEELIYQAILLFLQGPLILLYTAELGKQLAQ